MTITWTEICQRMIVVGTGDVGWDDVQGYGSSTGALLHYPRKAGLWLTGFSSLLLVFTGPNSRRTFWHGNTFAV